ncbi:MAG: NADH-quinone oxidoreductase subunit J, partial [Clostridia bacterium]|nr:NADH-quinone oxidoreductase subunit J [Clostridia bacterium]
FMRVVSSHDSKNIKPYLDAMFCSGCALCEMYSCHQGLSPRALIAEFKAGMRAKGVSVPKGVEAKPVPKHSELRRVPLSRLCTRLNLDVYNVSAPISENEYTPKSVKVLLSQHIGVPATPVIKVGDAVKRSDVIATTSDEKLGVSIHSSIDGIVKEITDKFIVIKSKGGVK